MLHVYCQSTPETLLIMLAHMMLGGGGAGTARLLHPLECFCDNFLDIEFMALVSWPTAPPFEGQECWLRVATPLTPAPPPLTLAAARPYPCPASPHPLPHFLSHLWD